MRIDTIIAVGPGEPRSTGETIGWHPMGVGTFNAVLTLELGQTFGAVRRTIVPIGTIITCSTRKTG